MAKSVRASVSKRNRANLRKTVFGPIVDARTERLAAKLQEIASQPKPEAPKKKEMDIEADETGMFAQNAFYPLQTTSLTFLFPTADQNDAEKATAVGEGKLTPLMTLDNSIHISMSGDLIVVQRWTSTTSPPRLDLQSPGGCRSSLATERLAPPSSSRSLYPRTRRVALRGSKDWCRRRGIFDDIAVGCGDAKLSVALGVPWAYMFLTLLRPLVNCICRYTTTLFWLCKMRICRNSRPDRGRHRLDRSTTMISQRGVECG
jgi:hypothetical protein